MPAQVNPTSTRAEAKNVEISHSGVAAPNTGAWVPKLSYLDPPSQPSSLWGGASVPVEFEIPQTTGKLMDAVLMMDVTTPGTALTAGTIPPTTHWVDSIESFLGSQMIERVVADDLLNETLLFLSDMELNSIAPVVNITTGGAYRSDTLPAASTTYRFFLPLWANAIVTAQPWCKGFTQKFKFRVNFAPNLYNSSGTSTTAPTITQVKLLVTEAQLKPEDERELERLHMRQTIEYRTVRRNKHVSTTKDFTNQPASEITEVLTEFAHTDSAGLLIYCRPSGGYAQYPNTARKALYELGLLDGRNTQLVPRVSGKFNEAFVLPNQLATSQAISESAAYIYLFPFCANLGRVLETGDPLGGLQLEGNEKLTYINSAASSATATIIHVESFEYCRIVVTKGNSAIYYRA